MGNDDLVEAETFPTAIAAAVASASLAARGIDSVIERVDPSGPASLTRVPEKVRLLVRWSDLAKAREVLQGAAHFHDGPDHSD